MFLAMRLSMEREEASFIVKRLPGNIENSKRMPDEKMASASATSINENACALRGAFTAGVINEFLKSRTTFQGG